jgi:hypothetical protein
VSSEVEDASLAALSLARKPSGPGTLSGAVFQMLFAELYAALNALPTNEQIALQPTSKDAFRERAISAGDRLGNSELYCVKMLQLLLAISESEVCSRQLLKKEWLQLLLSVLHYGPRLAQTALHILRKLLPQARPEQLSIPIIRKGMSDEAGVSEFEEGMEMDAPALILYLLELGGASVELTLLSDTNARSTNDLRHWLSSREVCVFMVSFGQFSQFPGGATFFGSYHAASSATLSSFMDLCREFGIFVCTEFG